MDSVRQAKHRFVRVKKIARMGLESHHGAGAAASERLTDDVLVSAVHAVEISESRHGTHEARRNGIAIAEDGERSGCGWWVFQHDNIVGFSGRDGVEFLAGGQASPSLTRPTIKWW